MYFHSRDQNRLKKGDKCHCVRKCSRGENLWSTDLGET